MHRNPVVPMHHVRCALMLLPLAVAPLAAQGLMLRDAIQMQPHMVAYDTARSRLVEVGRHGETRELDGTQWLLRPGPGPRLYGGLTWRSTARRVLAFGISYDITAATWEYDGVAWQQRTPAQQPAARNKFALTFDAVRDRVVLFGGTGNGLSFGDTWEWDGTNWAQRATTGPSARVDAGMAFDTVRGVSVLFGGQSSGPGLHNDTWEWNGTAWQFRTLPSAPSARSGSALAYDQSRARIVLFGGFTLAGVAGDVFEYDGVTWQSIAFTGGPAPRYHADLMFDAAHGESLLAGGFEATAVATDVFAWNGTRWRLVTAGARQPELGEAVGAAPEPQQGGVLMFGSILSQQAWRFAGGAWTLLPTTRAPAARMQPAMWSDGSHAWLFGGWSSLYGFSFSDTWQWTTSGWRSLPGAQPQARAAAAVAFDTARSRAVLFGGWSSTTGMSFGDTWTFDGVAWQQQTPMTVPPARNSHGMAFEPTRARVVMFGGGVAGVALRNDTWEWDGSNWSPVNPAARPPAYGSAALNFDARIGRIVATTAPSSGSSVPTAIEVWTYDGATWAPLPLLEPRVVAFDHSLVQVPGSNTLLVIDGASVQELVYQPALTADLGTPCTAQAPRLAARELPVPGNAAFGIDVVEAPPSAPVAIGGALASASLPIGNCVLQLQPPLTVVFVATNGFGFATHPIPVPAQPALLGVQCFFQAAVLLPGTPGGFTLSAALRVVVGE